MTGGARSSFDIFLRLHGQRKWSRDVSKAATELEAIGFRGAKGLDAFSKKSAALKSFGKSWTHHVSLPIAGTAIVAGKMAVDFSKAMSLVRTQAGASAKEAAFLEKGVLKMTERSKFGADEMADALFRVRSAGFKKKDALGILQQGRNLATLGNSNLEFTTKALTGAAKTLGISKLSQTRRLAAEMNAIVGTGDMRFEEMQDALSSGVLPAFVSAGLGMRDYGDALTVMTDRNVPAQRASTRLRTAITMLVPHSTKAKEALEGIGLQSEDLARVMRSKGLPAAIADISEHLSGLSKNKRNRVMIEAFGGAKSSATLETLVENSDELFRKSNLIREGIGKMSGELRVAERQPANELAKAWRSIEVSLIHIGDELLPLAVPAVKKIAEYGGKAADIFRKIPGSVAGIGTAALIAVGPLSSMLGYLAHGTGRFLKIANGMSKMGMRFNAVLSPNVMTEQSGFTGALSAAFGGTGAAGAARAVKGFATAVGPMAAAAGLGKIIYSATESDWREVGFEAGGATVGGLAAILTGNPELAPLGAGLGTFAGSVIDKLFSSGPKISKLRARTEQLTEATKTYREALRGIAPAERKLADARRRHHGAWGKEREAARHLAHAMGIYGTESGHAHRAQLALWRAQRKVISTGREEAAMHRFVGAKLQLYRQESIHNVGSIKQLLPGQRRRIHHLRAEDHARELSHEGLVELVKLEKRVLGEKHRLTALYAKAEKVAGKPWAETLKKLTVLQSEYGRKGRGLVTAMDKQREHMKLLEAQGLETTGMYKEAVGELRKMWGLYQRISRIGELPAPGSPARSGEKAHRTGHHHPGHRHHPSRRANTASTARRHRSASVGVAAQSGGGRDINITVQSILDGQVVAENTAKIARKEALLQ